MKTSAPGWLRAANYFFYRVRAMRPRVAYEARRDVGLSRSPFKKNNNNFSHSQLIAAAYISNPRINPKPKEAQNQNKYRQINKRKNKDRELHSHKEHHQGSFMGS